MLKTYTFKLFPRLWTWWLLASEGPSWPSGKRLVKSLTSNQFISKHQHTTREKTKSQGVTLPELVFSVTEGRMQHKYRLKLADNELVLINAVKHVTEITYCRLSSSDAQYLNCQPVRFNSLWKCHFNQRVLYVLWKWCEKKDGWSYLWGGSSWVLRLVFSAISRLFSSRRHNTKTVVWKFATSAVSKYSLLLLAGLSLPLSREILAAEDELKSAAVAGSKGRSTSTTSRPGCLRKCQFAALFCKLLERQSSHCAPISQAFFFFFSLFFFFAGWKSIWMGAEPEAPFAKGRCAE